MRTSFDELRVSSNETESSFNERLKFVRIIRRQKDKCDSSKKTRQYSISNYSKRKKENMIKKLFPYTKGYRRQTVLSAVFVIFEVILEISIPLMMSILVDVGVSGKEFPDHFIPQLWKSITESLGIYPQTSGFVWFMGGMMIFMAALSLFMGVASGLNCAEASNGFAANLRSALFRKVQEFSFHNVDKFSSASLITRTTTDVTNTQQAFQMLIRVAFRAPIMLIIAAITAFSIDWELALILCVAIPFLGVSIGIIGTKAFGAFRKMFERYDAFNLRVQENLTAIRVVKAFVKEDHETDAFRKAANDLCETSRKAEKIIIWNAPIMQFTMYATLIAVYFFGGQKIVFGQMGDGELLSFISYVSQILYSLMMISMIMVNLVLSRASISRIREVLDEVPDISDEGTDKDSRPADGSVRFENVSFTYIRGTDKYAIKDINLDIKSGETVGILGGTGSGKTSLVQLIPRLYDATKGNVYVGGRNVREYNLYNLREDVSMVLQSNLLFTGTIADNLRWGNENASMEEIRAAANAAQADEFVMSFPRGYDTEMGQGGVNVSGGQKQRLCIARALLKKPKILIFDDSTSAVDTATDKRIRNGLREFAAGTTVIVIAQRVNSVMDADKIIVMDDDGRIDAVGNHEELLRSNSIYREVYYSQTSGGEENE